MDDLMNCLYQFILENRLGNLREDEEYKAISSDINLQEERLRGCLNKKQRKELNWLLDAITHQDSIVNEHIFRASLALARELSALVRV